MTKQQDDKEVFWSEPILPDTEESQLPGKGVKAASNSAGGR
jgi:hypothetical protein